MAILVSATDSVENIKTEDGGSMFPWNGGNTGHFHMVPTHKSRMKIIIKKYYYLKSIVAANWVTMK